MARVDDEQAAHQLLRPRRDLLPPLALKMRRPDPLRDLLVDRQRAPADDRILAERRRAAEQNVEEHAEAPHVTSGVVAAVRVARLEHLRREVLRRPAERRRDALVADELGEPE
eukprot:5324056-Prymnesium_polylepis.1